MILPLFGLALAAMQTAEPVRVEAHWNGEVCTTLVDGVPLTAQQVATLAAGWKRDKRRVAVAASDTVPYRCIGGTIFALQAAGVTVGFVSEPEPRGGADREKAETRSPAPSIPAE